MDLRDAFKHFDKDGGWDVSQAEFRTALQVRMAEGGEGGMKEGRTAAGT